MEYVDMREIGLSPVCVTGAGRSHRDELWAVRVWWTFQLWVDDVHQGVVDYQTVGVLKATQQHWICRPV